MANATVLFYDPKGEDWGAKLQPICMVQGLRLRKLTAGHLDYALGNLAQGMEPKEPAGEAIGEPILIFCHLSGPQLDRLLAALRKAGVPRTCLKAVLTPTNASWVLRDLYAELCRERDRLG